MDYIKFKIEKARPAIRAVTIQNYLNFLKGISLRVTNSKFKNLDFLEDNERVIIFLEKYKLNSRRAVNNAIIVALGALNDPFHNKIVYDKYGGMLREKVEEIKQQKLKDPKVAEQWKSMEELRKINNKWRRMVNADDIPNRDELTKKSQQILQNYLITSLYTLMPPRRHIYSNIELILTPEFKKLSKIQLQRNYLVFSKGLRRIFFHFGYQKSQKEADTHAYQKPPPRLWRILQLYLRFNSRRQWLLYNIKGEPMSSNTLGVQVKALFGVGTTMIRKIFITENTKEAHKKIDDLAAAMGHSPSVAKSSYLQNS